MNAPAYVDAEPRRRMLLRRAGGDGDLHDNIYFKFVFVERRYKVFVRVVIIVGVGLAGRMEKVMMMMAGAGSGRS